MDSGTHSRGFYGGSLWGPAASGLIPGKNLSPAETESAKSASLAPYVPCNDGERFIQGKGSKKGENNIEFVISKNSTEVDSTGNNKIYITIS